MNEKSPTDMLPVPPLAERPLTPDEMTEKLRDPSYLPTHEDVLLAFGTQEYLSDEWYAFCNLDKENPVWDLLNVEFINAFSEYLSIRAKSMGASEDAPLVVLEVGAGNGRLTHFLQAKLGEKLPGKIKVVATDSGDWEEIKAAFPVEKIGHKEALQRYQPKIVVFSWMPQHVDFTGDFRAAQSVEEYILIGETDNTCCGDEWLTWGCPRRDKDGKKIEEDPPYIVDGFERKDLDGVSKHQICRSDMPGHFFHSKTVSFRRMS